MAQMPYQTISSCHPGIVNNVLFNRELNCLYSSGMKKAIVLHTPYSLGFEEENDQDPLTKERGGFKYARHRVSQLPFSVKFLPP